MTKKLSSSQIRFLRHEIKVVNRDTVINGYIDWFKNFGLYGRFLSGNSDPSHVVGVVDGENQQVLSKKAANLR